MPVFAFQADLILASNQDRAFMMSLVYDDLAGYKPVPNPAGGCGAEAYMG